MTRIGVLTSGGDAPGMNADIRAVVRAGITAGAEVFGVLDGWQGAVDGGDRIRTLTWDDVAGIAAAAGTVLGTSRCRTFRDHDGRRDAVASLVRAGIDRLVVLGGDGSLTGADLLATEWPDHLEQLVAHGVLTADDATAHPALAVAGIGGSIDNDLVGTDMTIGADSALQRIVEAVDAIASTAAFKDRNFVIEVMGRHCGYLALMSAIAGGADYVMVPEQPAAGRLAQSPRRRPAPRPRRRTPHLHRGRRRRRRHRRRHPGDLRRDHGPASQAPPATRSGRRRVGVLHCGGVAPGMNSAAQAFVRLGLDRGYEVVGVRGGFPGLIAGDVVALGWPDIEGWVRDSGSHLGTRRTVPTADDLTALASAIESQHLDALVVTASNGRRRPSRGRSS